MYWNNTFAGVEKNVKCEFVDDVFDLILYLYRKPNEKYQKYCIRLINNSNYYFTKQTQYVNSILVVYYLDVEWVLSQQNIPERINYIASWDFEERRKNEEIQIEERRKRLEIKERQIVERQKEKEKQELIQKEKEKQELIQKKQKREEMEKIVNQNTKLDIPAYWWDR